MYIVASKQKYDSNVLEITHKLFPHPTYCFWMKYHIDSNQNIIITQYKNNDGIHDIDDINKIAMN